MDWQYFFNENLRTKTCSWISMVVNVLMKILNFWCIFLWKFWIFVFLWKFWIFGCFFMKIWIFGCFLWKFWIFGCFFMKILYFWLFFYENFEFLVVFLWKFWIFGFFFMKILKFWCIFLWKFCFLYCQVPVTKKCLLRNFRKLTAKNTTKLEN